MKTSRTEELYDVIRLVRPLYKVLEATVALELTETGEPTQERLHFGYISAFSKVPIL